MALVARSEGVTQAVFQARRWLRDSQGAAGSWNAVCDLGPAATAHVAVALRFIGALESGEAEGIGRWLVRQQRSDGSFAGRPFATEGDFAATAAVWAGLAAAGLSAEHPAVRDARRYLDANGGRERLLALWSAGELAPLLLAMVGLFPADALSVPPAALALLPGVDAAVERRLSVILPYRMRAVGAIVRRLRASASGGSPLDAATSLLEARRCRAHFDRFQNLDGSWLYGDTMHAALTLAALAAVGTSPTDPRFARGLSWLRRQAQRDGDGVWYCIFQTDVWTTAFDVRALLATGVDLSDRALSRAVTWLVGCQRGGTWAFQAENTSMPDCDDAGVALAALALALAGAPPGPLADRVARSIGQARRWLTSRQNGDGGWASFQQNLTSKPPGAFMTAPPRPMSQSPLAFARLLAEAPPEYGDPATEDVTGRVLYGLGLSGSTTSDPAVRRAMAFLERQQCGNGAFWGRWVVNYLAATAWVLRGLAAVRADRDLPMVRRALSFLRAHQNPDGGFGEDVRSYSHPEEAGRGESTAALTGLVVSALIETGEGGSPVVARAIDYLVAQQVEGSWPTGPLLHALVPPDLFYTLPGTSHQLPLEALGLYERKVLAMAPAEALTAGSRFTPALLEEAARWGDPVADGVMADLLASGRPEVAFELVHALVRTDDPVPAGLPERARRYFEETAALPTWADPARMESAQRLFERWGWLVATSLFCSALPQCYVFPHGARVLGYTGAIEKTAWRRIVETAQFVFDVAARGGLAPDARGVRTTQKVRLIHAGVRVLARRRGWRDEWGVPISQQQLAGTLMTFSCVVTDDLRALGAEISPSEAEDWLHLWTVVGHVLGIDARLLPPDVASGDALLETLTRHHAAPSQEGTRLAEATAALMKELLPGELFDGLYCALARHLAGEACADMLSLPAADWTRHLVAAGALLDRTVDAIGGDSPLVLLGQRSAFLMMRAVSAWSRQGKEVSFRIPDELLTRWEAEQTERLRL